MPKGNRKYGKKTVFGSGNAGARGSNGTADDNKGAGLEDWACATCFPQFAANDFRGYAFVPGSTKTLSATT